MSGPTPVQPVSLDQAREMLARLHPRLDRFLSLRADLAELQADLAQGVTSRHGGVPELKGIEARLHSELEFFALSGAQVKGFAPLLLDWPGTRDDVPVLWCWLEGEPDVAWYHRVDCGFPGRRPV